VQLLDFPLAGVLGIHPDPGVESPRRVVQQTLPSAGAAASPSQPSAPDAQGDRRK
jgi:hypothetical protein